jgi:hypothetical protein
MEDTMYYTLPQFLARSSPLLRSLSIRLDDTDFDWAECFSLIGATLENLEVEYPLSHVQSAIFTCHDNNNSEIRPPFPRLQTFRLKTQSGIEYGTLIRFLDARTRRSEFVTLRSFHLVCSRDTFLDDNIYAPSSADGQYRHDEVAGHLASLARSRGIDINIGADGGKTHVNFWYVLILG